MNDLILDPITVVITPLMVAVCRFNEVCVFVLQVTKHGLILSFLTSFSGHVDFLHMETEQTSSYTEGAEVKLT